MHAYLQFSKMQNPRKTINTSKPTQLSSASAKDTEDAAAADWDEFSFNVSKQFIVNEIFKFDILVGN